MKAASKKKPATGKATAGRAAAKPVKPVAKKKPAAAPAKKAKPVAKKAAAKPVAKPAAKAAAKKPLKPTTKPVAKPAAKPVTKTAPKPAAKAVAKPAAKPAAKAAAKPAAKPAPKAPPAKPEPAAKPAAKPVALTKPAKPPRADRPALLSPAPETMFKKEYVPVSASVATQDLATTKLPPVNQALKDVWKKKPPEQLTDEEVLAMPDSAYMNEVQLAFFRHRLQQMQQDLLKNADETTEHLREDTLTVPDPADRATIEEEHALELRTRDRERKLMKKIHQALGLIDSGEYGYCEETGEPIGVRRLLARPTATLSLEAQQRRELKQKLFGD